MKRSPTWDERMLVHAILSSGECECVAIVPENFDPFAMAQLRESLPKIPGLPEWRITRDEASSSSTAIEFTVRRGSATVSQNRATQAGDTIVLKTLLFGSPGELSFEQAADIAQCAAVALLTGRAL